jgi:hypothetical protein
MQKKTKIYVEYFHPGMIIIESSAREVGNRDVILAAMKIPSTAHAFQFYDQEVVIDEDGKMYLGEISNRGKRYYPGGKIIERNGETWVETRFGRLYQFDSRGDRILPG